MTAKVRKRKPTLQEQLSQSQHLAESAEREVGRLRTEVERLTRERDAAEKRVARAQLPNATKDLFALECPLCADAYRAQAEAINAIHDHQRSIYGSYGGFGERLLQGTHSRCRSCTILLGVGHLDPIGEMCRSCAERELASSKPRSREAGVKE